MNFEEWAPLERRIRAAYPDFAADAETQDVYLDVLADVDAGAVERAVDELLREGHTAAPPPGVIRERALGRAASPPVAAPIESRDHGARRGIGWVGVLAAGALAAGVVALVLVLVDNDGTDTTITAPEVTVTREAPTVTVERPSVTVSPPEIELPGDEGDPATTTP